MSTVAEKLRHAREDRKLTVYHVAETTKIRTDHIRALEEGNFDVFSAPVYIRGFVRSYATLLKLDVPATMAELDAELSQTDRFRDPPPLGEQRGGWLDFVMLQLSRVDLRKSLAGLAVLAVAIAGACGFLIWRHQRTAKPVNLPPAVYHAPASGGDTLPMPQPAPKR